MLKFLCKDRCEKLVSLREVGIAVATSLVEYVVVFVVCQNLVEVDLASGTDDLAAGVTAAVVVIVAFADVIFDYDYIVCAAVDVVVLLVMLFFMLQLMMLVSLLLLMLMHNVYVIIFELMIWRVFVHLVCDLYVLFSLLLKLIV